MGSTIVTFRGWCPITATDGIPIHNACFTWNIILTLVTGTLVNGPYALITTAVSAELGQHPSLRGSGKALATVTAIIDGTGSIGGSNWTFPCRRSCWELGKRLLHADGGRRARLDLPHQARQAGGGEVFEQKKIY